MEQHHLDLNIQLFDHGIFPISQKWGLLNLYNFYQKVQVKRDRNNRIEILYIKSQLIQNLPGVNPNEAELYLLVYKLLVESTNVIDIDIKKFTVFLFLQMYTTNNQRINFDQQQNKKQQFNESIRSSQKDLFQNYSPMNSPRSKTTKQTMSESQQIIFFIKFNLKTILKLISHENNNSSQSQVNGISIIFTNTFKVFQQTIKYDNEQIQQIITDLVSYTECQKSIISNLTRSVQMKDKQFCQNNPNIKIINCEDSQIFIMGVVNTIQIQNCSNCNIFVLGCQQICSVDKCESINLTLISFMLRIGNTIDSQFYYYGPNGPVLYGDNRQIQLGPHNANTIELPYVVRKIEMQLTSQLAIKFQDPIILNQNKNNYKIIKPREISMCILPNQSTIEASRCKDFEKLRELVTTQPQQPLNSSRPTGVIIPVLSPGEYKQEVYLRYKNIMDYQKKLIEASLSPEQMKLLHMAIQGHFREWLVNSGSYKQVNDLLRMIDQEHQAMQ